MYCGERKSRQRAVMQNNGCQPPSNAEEVEEGARIVNMAILFYFESALTSLPTRGVTLTVRS